MHTMLPSLICSKKSGWQFRSLWHESDRDMASVSQQSPGVPAESPCLNVPYEAFSGKTSRAFGLSDRSVLRCSRSAGVAVAEPDGLGSEQSWCAKRSSGPLSFVTQLRFNTGRRSRTLDCPNQCDVSGSTSDGIDRGDRSGTSANKDRRTVGRVSASRIPQSRVPILRRCRVLLREGIRKNSLPFRIARRTFRPGCESNSHGADSRTLSVPFARKDSIRDNCTIALARTRDRPCALNVELQWKS